MYLIIKDLYVLIILLYTHYLNLFFKYYYVSLNAPNFINFTFETYQKFSYFSFKIKVCNNYTNTPERLI